MISNINKAKVIEKTAFSFLLFGLLLSYQLWHSDRLFPLLPVANWIPDFVAPYDSFLAYGLILLILASIFINKKMIKWGFIVLFLVFLLQDQMRWQPWIYTYLLVIIPFLWTDRNRNYSKAGLIEYLQILLSGIYVWSGFHKFNASFFENSFIPLTRDTLGLPNHHFLLSNIELSYAIPIIEILIGIGILFPKTRKLSLIGGVFMHLFILTYLFRTNTNIIVIPWNIAMIIFLFLGLFRENNPTLSTTNIRQFKSHLFITLLAWIAPAFNLLGIWDDYASFKLYSGDKNDLFIAIEENELDNIDNNILQYSMDLIQQPASGKVINVTKWAFNELKVPVPPQDRVFKSICRVFCELNIDENKVVFLVYERPLSKGVGTQFQCSDLE